MKHPEIIDHFKTNIPYAINGIRPPTMTKCSKVGSKEFATMDTAAVAILNLTTSAVAGKYIKSFLDFD